MKNIIITGANGFIGSSLLNRLLLQSVRIVAIDVEFTKDRVPENPMVTKVLSSLSDEDELVQQLSGDTYDAFYHLAWRGVNGSEKANPVIQAENIKAAMRCASIAKRLNCGKFLCAGTIAEQATDSLYKLDTTSGGMLYGVAKYSTHLLLETYCKNVGLPFVWMQFSNIYGSTNKTGNLVSYTLGQLAKGEEAAFGPANQYYDFIYIEDLLEAITQLGLCNTTKNAYFIGSGTPRLLKDYLQEIGQLYGRPDLIRIGARPDDGIAYRMDMFDISDLIADIGSFITMSFTEGIQKTIAEF